MKLKNVKIGVRVQLEIDDPHETRLKKGAKGTIIEGNNYHPYISWDGFTFGSNGDHTNQTRIDLGLPEKSVSYTSIKYLKRIK